MPKRDYAKIAESCPIDIPSNAKIVDQTQNGYDQIKYTWSDDTYKYEARWHTARLVYRKGKVIRVVTRTTWYTRRSTKVQHILTGENQWTLMKRGRMPKARQNGAATSEQQKLLDSIIGQHLRRNKMDRAISKYYEGFEGEPEICLIRVKKTYFRQRCSKCSKRSAGISNRCQVR